MKRSLLLLLALLSAAPALAQIADNKGRPIMACVPPDATAPGTFLVGDGSGPLNVIVDSGAITCSATDLDIRNLNATDDIVQVRGAAASGAAKAGNPVQIGGVFNTTQPTVTNGQAVEAQSTARGAAIVATGVDAFAVNATQSGSWSVTVTGLPNEGQQTMANSISTVLASDQSAIPTTVSTFPDNEPFNMAQKGGATLVAGPCEREVTLYVQISQTTGTQLVTGTASERVYICSISLVTATAQNIALVDGTGSVCATSPTGLLGGSTAATGQNFGANGGWVLPYNPYAYAKTSTDADNVCLLQSGAGQVSGVLTYVSIPNI